MRIILKHIFRNLKEHKLRSIFIFFSLLISTAVLVISISIPEDLIIKIESTMRSVYGKSDILISSNDKFNIDDIKFNDTDYEYVGVNKLLGVNEDKDKILIIGLDIDKASGMDLLPDDISKLGDNEIVVNKRLSEEKGYQVGDIIEFNYQDKLYKLTIKDIIDNKGLASTYQEEDVFYTSINNINSMGSIDNDNYMYLYMNIIDDDKIDSFTKYTIKHNKNYMVSKVVDIESIKESSSMVSMIMYMILLMATLMIFFVVGSLNKIILAERIPVIGTFRSIGASRSKMNMILVLENALYGLFAGIFGSIIGTYLNGFVSGSFITTVGVDLSKESIKISPKIVIIGVVFAVLLQVLITLKEIIRTNKKPIKVLIFNTQNSRYKLRKRRTILGFIFLILSFVLFNVNVKLNMLIMVINLVLFMLGISFVLPIILQLLSKGLIIIFKKLRFNNALIACKNICYNKMIIASSRLVVISLSIVISIIMMSISITKLFNSFREVCKGYDLIVLDIDKKYDNLNDISGINNIDYSYSLFINKITYNGNKKFKTTPIIYAEEEKQRFITEYDYKIKDLKDNEILVDEKYAFKNDLKKGDTIVINYEDINKEFKYKIVDYMDSSYFTTPRNVMVVSFNHFINDLKGKPFQIFIDVESDEDLEYMIDVVNDNIDESGIRVMTTENYINDQEESTASIVNIVYLVLGISVLLAFVGVINNQTISFMQRRKELAVLNSTCMTKGQIKKMLLLETLIVNLLTILIAVIVSIFTTILVNSFIDGIELYMIIKYDLMIAIKFSLLIYIFLLLTLIVPFRRLKKMNIVEEIKYE